MMLRKLIALGSLLAATAPLAAQDHREVFRDVPRDHWAYLALDQTERAGVFTSFPEGTFRGKRLLTRYEVAVAIQRVAQAVLRSDAATGAGSEGTLRGVVLQKLKLTTPAKSPELPRLIAEFTPELKLLGADPEALRRQIEQRLPPDRAPATDPGVRSKEYEKGVKLARQEWEKGETVLYSGGLSPALTIDEKLGIPLHIAFGCVVNQEMLDLARGHNEEVYRLILERGLPANNRVRWMAEILQPKEVWADPARTRAKVPYGGPDVTSPAGDVTLRLRVARGEQPPRLEIFEKGAKPFQWDLYRLERRTPTVTAMWGSPGSHLLFLRYPEAKAGVAGRYSR